MRRLAISFLAVSYAVASLGVAAWMALIAEFHCYNQGCDESTADWTQAHEAWQWDAIIALGLLGGLAALVTLALMVPQRPLFPLAGLAVHGAVLVPALALLVAGDEFSEAQLVLLATLVLGSGGTAIYLRSSRQMPGTRRE